MEKNILSAYSECVIYVLILFQFYLIIIYCTNKLMFSPLFLKKNPVYKIQNNRIEHLNFHYIILNFLLWSLLHITQNFPHLLHIFLINVVLVTPLNNRMVRNDPISKI